MLVEDQDLATYTPQFLLVDRTTEAMGASRLKNKPVSRSFNPSLKNQKAPHVSPQNELSTSATRA